MKAFIIYKNIVCLFLFWDVEICHCLIIFKIIGALFWDTVEKYLIVMNKVGSKQNFPGAPLFVKAKGFCGA